MTVSSRTSLVLWMLLPAFTLSADVPSCPNRSKFREDDKMKNYTGPLIDIENCTQSPVVLYPNGIWKLASTGRNPLQFVFTPHDDFEYFEILFSRGQRSNSYYSVRVNRTLVDVGPYAVSITFRSEPVTSTTPRIVVDIFINSSNGPPETNRQSGEGPRYPPESEDDFLAGFKEISCSSELAPDSQVLSAIVILAAGGSEWLFLPDPVWSECPFPPPNRNLNIPEDARRHPVNDSSNRGPPRTPEVSVTTAFPTRRFRTKEPPEEDTWFVSTTITWDDRIQPRLPEHDFYGRNRSSSPAPDVTGYHEDLIHRDDQGDPTSNATEGRVLKESGLVGDAVIASSIVGVLAIVLLAIGCCFLFRNLNLQGSYGVHSNSYEPHSSVHLRDSQYDHDSGRANPGHTVTDMTASHATKPTTSQQTTESHATKPTTSQQTPTSHATTPTTSQKRTASPATTLAAGKETTTQPGGGLGGVVNQTIDEESEGTSC